MASWTPEKLSHASSKLDRFGNIIPETNEELKVLVERLEQDFTSFSGWGSYSSINNTMRGDKYELLKQLNFASDADYQVAAEATRLQEDISKQLVS